MSIKAIGLQWSTHTYLIGVGFEVEVNFSKYHALGNVYIVIEPGGSDFPIAEDEIIRLCSRNYGLCSDGVLIGPIRSAVADFGLRIFNPDGSEAEKSGNGLRIFCRYLYDKGLVEGDPFSIETKGGIVQGWMLDDGRSVRVEMGVVSFSSMKIPVYGGDREVLLEDINVDGERLKFSAVTIGNPHCVIFVKNPSEKMAKSVGPIIENHPLFPNRTNVQFVRVIDSESIQIEIWERGAGYTYASGSSSCAAAAVANKLGYCGRSVSVNMRGGQILIDIDESNMVTMSGSVTSICSGVVSDEIFKSYIANY